MAHIREDRIPCVYQVTNLLNGRIYIGVHCDSSDALYLGSGQGIKAAVKKYGRFYFEKSVIAEVNTLQEAYQLEATIVTSGFVARRDTYNQTVGGKIPPSQLGKRFPGRVLSIETRAKLRAIKLGRKLTGDHLRNVRLGGLKRRRPRQTPVSAETRILLSIASRRRRITPESEAVRIASIRRYYAERKARAA